MSRSRRRWSGWKRYPQHHQVAERRRWVWVDGTLPPSVVFFLKKIIFDTFPPGRHCPRSAASSSSASLTSSSSTQCFVATRDVLSSLQIFDRHLESVSARRKVNTWICVPRATDRDLASKHRQKAKDVCSSGKRP